MRDLLHSGQHPTVIFKCCSRHMTKTDINYGKDMMMVQKKPFQEVLISKIIKFQT